MSLEHGKDYIVVRMGGGKKALRFQGYPWRELNGYQNNFLTEGKDSVGVFIDGEIRPFRDNVEIVERFIAGINIRYGVSISIGETLHERNG